MAALGVEAITGNPYKPTTQGKNERFHQTLFRYLDKQPLAETLEQLASPGRCVRPHLQHRTTSPRIPWARHSADRMGSDSEGRGAPPRPRPADLFDRPAPRPRPRPPVPLDLPADTHVRTINTAGTISLDSVTYKVDAQRAFEQVLVVTADDTIIIADLQGEVLVEHTRPAPGVNYVGNGRPSGPQPRTRELSPKS